MTQDEYAAGDPCEAMRLPDEAGLTVPVGTRWFLMSGKGTVTTGGSGRCRGPVRPPATPSSWTSSAPSGPPYHSHWRCSHQSRESARAVAVDASSGPDGSFSGRSELIAVTVEVPPYDRQDPP
jgi:hypothetical protein